jgi:hypothetical protein
MCRNTSSLYEDFLEKGVEKIDIAINNIREKINRLSQSTEINEEIRNLAKNFSNMQLAMLSSLDKKKLLEGARANKMHLILTGIFLKNQQTQRSQASTQHIAPEKIDFSSIFNPPSSIESIFQEILRNTTPGTVQRIIFSNGSSSGNLRIITASSRASSQNSTRAQRPSVSTSSRPESDFERNIRGRLNRRQRTPENEGSNKKHKQN